MSQMVNELRIGAAAQVALHLEHHLRKLISEGFSSVDDVRMQLESFCPEVRQKCPDADNPEELLKYILQEEARLTAKPNCYSGFSAIFQIMIGYTWRPVLMVEEEPKKKSGKNHRPMRSYWQAFSHTHFR